MWSDDLEELRPETRALTEQLRKASADLGPIGDLPIQVVREMQMSGEGIFPARVIVPALFSIGTRDPLFDDSVLMHARWKLAGNDAELCVYPDACHAFDAFPGAMADAATTRIDAFVAAIIG